MSEAVVHECPDGQRFRVNMIQEIREQPLVQGVRYAFQVDPDQEEESGTSVRMNGSSEPKEHERVRTMVLVLSVTKEGLICDPFWEDSEGNRQQALGSTGSNGSGPTQAERGKYQLHDPGGRVKRFKDQFADLGDTPGHDQVGYGNLHDMTPLQFREKTHAVSQAEIEPRMITDRYRIEKLLRLCHCSPTRRGAAHGSAASLRLTGNKPLIVEGEIDNEPAEL